MQRRLIVTLVSLAAAAATLQGCASMEPAETAVRRDENVYVTGSNVPKKDKNAAQTGVTVVGKGALEAISNQSAGSAPNTGR